MMTYCSSLGLGDEQIDGQEKGRGESNGQGKFVGECFPRKNKADELF